MKTTANAAVGILSVTAVMTLVLVFMSGVALGDVVTQQLESITAGMSAPEDVAVSPDGKIYVVDAGSGRVLIYNANNQLLDSLLIDRPTSVAVGVSGYKYVATNNKFHVKILNSSDKVINYLGNGYEEFILPINIAVDGTNGKVYVVDQLDNSIKVYTASGSYVKKISDESNQPIDLAVWGNALYVVDQPLVTDSNNGKIRGARVAVFDKTSGNYLRSFGTFGVGVGQLSKPKGITVDSKGLLYISDSLHGVVQCFDTNGTFLGAIQNTKDGEMMSRPQGLAVTSNGKLYVALSGVNDPPGLKVFGVNRALVVGSDLLVSPEALAFGTVSVGSSSSARTVTVTSNGTETLVLGSVSLGGMDAGGYAIVTDSCSGRSLAALSTCTIDVVAAPKTEGENVASLVIQSNDSDRSMTSVSLSATAVGIPAIVVSPAAMDFGFAGIGGVSAVQSLTIGNTGSSALSVAGIAVGGYYSSEFRITGDGCTGKILASAENCTIGVSFAPLAEGNRTGSLTVQSNDPAKPNLVVGLSGKGYGYPDIRVTALSVDFGVVAVGTVSANRTLTFLNQGTVGLYIGKIEMQGNNPFDFLISPNTCSERVLPPGGTCDVKLIFYPAQSEGNKTASLLVPSNDPDQAEIRIALQGSASVTPELSVKPGPANSKGRWVSVYIELPQGFSIEEIDLSTVVLNRVNGVEIEPPLLISGPVEIGDYNRNGVADLMVRFSRQELFALLNPGDSIITVSGVLNDGTVFEQSSLITVDNKSN